MQKYQWKKFDGERWIDVTDADRAASEPFKRIAIVATSSGFSPTYETNSWVTGRAKALHECGLEVYAPQYHESLYEDDFLVFDHELVGATTRVSGSRDRGVSPGDGANQIIDCVENGWDIFPFMGGIGFVDKIGAVINYFDEAKMSKSAGALPSQPIRIFNFSDCSYAAFLQSHHPDIFRFYSTTSSRDFYRDQADASPAERAEYDEIKKRNLDALRKLLMEDAVDRYPRPVIYFPTSDGGERVGNAQYFPLHSDMIWADAINFDIDAGGRGERARGEGRFGRMLHPAPKLNTSRPYILGFESFLQLPGDKSAFDNDFIPSLREFLRQRKESGELPVAIEMGLFETRLDGNNGYDPAKNVNRMHDEQTGLIKTDGFNVKRLHAHHKEITEQIKKIISEKDAGKSGVTEINSEVEAQVRAGLDLTEAQTEAQIKLILKLENEKIKAKQEEVKKICEEFEVPLLVNHRHGHSLNQGVVGGGFVNFRMNQHEALLQQLPTTLQRVQESEVVRTSPSTNLAAAAAASAAQVVHQAQLNRM